MSGPAKAAARDAGMRGRNTYNKISNAIAQTPRKHATTTAPILSSFYAFCKPGIGAGELDEKKCATRN